MTYREAITSAKRAYLYRVLSESGGSMTKAAKLAGVNRVNLYRIMKRHGVQVEHRRYVRAPDK